MKVVKFNMPFKMNMGGENVTVTAKGQYVFSDFILNQFIQSAMAQQAPLDKIIKYVKNIDEVQPPLNLENTPNNISGVLMVRTGGIGDLLALSNTVSIVNYYYNNIINTRKFKLLFSTNITYKEVFKYFEDFCIPIFYFKHSVEKTFKKYGLLSTKRIYSIYFEGIIEESEENWFDLQHKRIGLTDKIKLKFPDNIIEKRPKLISRKDAISKSIQTLRKQKSSVLYELEELKKKYKLILISHRASAQIRTFNPHDVVTTLTDYLKSKGIENFKFILLPRNFMKKDQEYLNNNDYCYFLKTSTITEYFYTLAFCDFVISSDTASFHFCEGIKHNALGLYSSFPTKMRTSTYKYTNSFDIIFNDCEFCRANNYVGCASHFKVPYELCVYIANMYRNLLKSEHHFKRGNRIPNKRFVDELNKFVQEIGEEKLYDMEIFQYAPCLSSKFNKTFKEQLYQIYEKIKIDEVLNK